MANPLRRIMLRIARLSRRDQSWLLRQLSKDEYEVLAHNNGLPLLEAAQRFRDVHAPADPLPIASSAALPNVCQALAMKHPLYSAIVIHEGQYEWQDTFLQNFDQEGHIRRALDNQVPDINASVRDHLLREWEAQDSFESWMEREDG